MSGPDPRNRLTAEVVAWLEAPDPARLAASVAGWDAPSVRQVLFTQGLGPYLHHRLEQLSLASLLPPDLRSWLHLEYDANERRMEVMHSELAALLAEANRLGVAVAPLKGSVLSVRHYPSPALRPMADLDILVRPEDERGMSEVLTGLGYRLAAGDRRAHRTFSKPGARVASWDTDHPDNPRPVELHTQLKRPLWLSRSSPDLTAYLWSQSREGELLGQKAWLPSDEALLVDLAQHATRHCLERSGRVLHWLDLALVAARLTRFDPPDADWTYPALRLAARAFPSRFETFPLEPLAARTLPRLRQLAETLPLDERAGLNVSATHPARLGPWALRWFWWRPTPWRVTMAFPTLPSSLAYPAYVGVVGLHLAKRFVETRRSG